MKAAVAARAAATGRGARMLAWRLHAYGAGGEGGLGGQLRLEEARVPPLRAPTDVLVRVRAASINPLDVAMIGGYGARVLNTLRTLEGAEGVEFPLVLGRDFVGVVERAGSGVGSRATRGQRVWGVVPPHRAGSHAQLVAVDASCLGAAPPALPDLQAGGALYAALSACAALRAAGLPPGRRAPSATPRVLLLGLGGVGHVALQLLVHSGAQVIVGCAGAQGEEARARGAAGTLDRHAPDYERALVECGPYEAIIDCAGLGGGEASAHAWQFSRYVTLTTPLLRHTDASGLGAGCARAAAELVGHTAAVLARTVRPAAAAPAAAALCPPHVRWAFFSPRAEDIDLLRRLVDQGKVEVLVEQVWGWREAQAAYERAARTGPAADERAARTGPAAGARGKLVLDFTR